MRKSLGSFLIVFLLLLSEFGYSQKTFTVESVPKPTTVDGGFLSDPGQFLNPNDFQSIRQLLLDIEKSTTAQVAVVILPSIGEENSKDFATRLFNHWGIGYQDKDNGLLILAVMDMRKTEFETGYGMEAVLPDVYCYRIGMQKMVPAFQKGQYGIGISATLIEIKRLLENPDAIADIRSNRKKSTEEVFKIRIKIYTYFALLFGFCIIAWILFNFYSKTEYYDKYHAIKSVKWVILIFIFPIPYLIIYPLLGRLLKYLRRAPRFSKETGAQLRLLTEEEEDDFLSNGQITEEDIGSVDYDVWVDETGSDLLILRYLKPFTKYKSCPKCSFSTFHLSRTVTIQSATRHHAGHGQKIYDCKNCHYKKKETFTISRTGGSGGGGFSGGGGGGGSSFGGGSSGGGGASVSW